MAGNPKNNDVVKHVVTVQVIHLHCPNCGEEKDEIMFCSDCKAPLRVIDVKTYYGNDAEEKLKEFTNRDKEVVITTEYPIDSVQRVGVENAIVDQDDPLDSIDSSDSSEKVFSENDEWGELEKFAEDNGVFGEEEEEEGERNKIKAKTASDPTWTDVLDEEDSFDDGLKDLEDLDKIGL